MKKIAIIVFAVLVVGSYYAVNEVESTGSVKDNFGENWGR